MSRHGIVATSFLVVAMVLGGGGSPSPANEVLVQLGFAVAVLAWVYWAGRPAAGVPRPLLLLGLGILAVPIVQLVPLPPAIWQALPSRELQLATLALIDEEDSWRPLSISPSMTLAGLLALIPAIGAMWAASVLSRRDRGLLVRAIALVALASALLGALQMAGGPDGFRLYDKTHRGWLTGFHANRNAAADVLLIGSLALSAWYARSGRRNPNSRSALPVFVAAQLVLLVAVVLSGSRMGMGLVLVTLGFHWLLLRTPGARTPRNRLVAAGLALVALCVAVPLAIATSPRLARVASRFDLTGDARFPLWSDSLRAIDGFWPSGSGIGTFPLAFQPFENPDNLTEFFPNRAHNDYLEFALETGLLAPVCLLAGVFVLANLARKAWRLSHGDHALQLFAMGSLAVIALHSLVDYPLRNMAIACLAGVAAGILVAVPSTVKSHTGRKGREDTQ